jgi:hypothetical protein
MNKVLICCALGLSGILFGSCNGSDKIASLQKTIENTHDATMKDMADMERISRSLKTNLAKMDSLHITGAPSRKPSPACRRHQTI